MPGLSDEGVRNLFSQVSDLWVNPEIEKRKRVGGLPADFRIRSCLVRLPLHRPPIVEFNNEITWATRMRWGKPRAVDKDEPIYLHDVGDIEDVSLPEVDGRRVAFFWITRNGSQWHMVFDLGPNQPDCVEGNESEESTRPLRDSIASILREGITTKVIDIHDDNVDLLRRIGLWAAPALLPYPLSEICRRLRNGEKDGAVQLLADHCNPEFLTGLCDKWWGIDEFRTRQSLILDALDAHKRGKYTLSISALLPHVEGIITDWVARRVPPDDLPWHHERKTKKFHNLVLESPPSQHSYRRILQSAIDFILKGPMLTTFKQWFDAIDGAFPNRHAVGHGKYDPQLFSEVHSVRLFLLLDTVYYIMSKHKSDAEQTET
ncbi:MAG: hypothetical protein JW889_16965 [Verrucomicrobia bacterium]|nr:hypothetical protein [Verrucomicrobiota bacterium]